MAMRMDLEDWLVLGLLSFFGAALIGIFAYLYWDYVTPDAYINGRPVEFVETCLSGHTTILPVTMTHTDGKTVWTSVTMQTVFVCDYSRTDTVYVDR